MYAQPTCDCFVAGYDDLPWPELTFHRDVQDTECSAWKRLLDLVEEAIADGRKVFAPRNVLGDDMARIVTLPPTISKLKRVTSLEIYGTHLSSLPPEIGDMERLEEFDPYTSHRLHWVPYEITRCTRLRKSRISTRKLYGNYKYRPPFPRLSPWALGPWQPGTPCSVCRGPIVGQRPDQVWISLRVATDVLPLLVNACSEACIARLPAGEKNYVQHPHRGGLEVVQPVAR